MNKLNPFSLYTYTPRKGAAAALDLLNRKADDAYIAEWTNILAQPKEEEPKSGDSVVLFRLGNEWVAIKSIVCSQVISSRIIHRVPHRSNEVLMGVVNFEGKLVLCVNLHNFLAIEQDKNSTKGSSTQSFSRMIAIQKEKELWIFPVDEVMGIVKYDQKVLENIPVTLSKSTNNYLRGLISWEGRNVGYLDEELLFYSLKRSIL